MLWHDSERDYRGRQDVYDFFAEGTEHATIRFEEHAILANDEHCVALMVASFTKGGQSFEAKRVHVYHLVDGRVVEFWDDFWGTPADQATGAASSG